MAQEKNGLLPRDEEYILAQVKHEIMLSREYVGSIREEFRTRHKLYSNQRKQRDKVGDTLIYNIINTQLAIYYTDEMTVSFQHRDMSDVMKAQNIENLGKFDHDEMDMEILNYFIQWDRQFYGVGIRVLTNWDKDTNTPIPQWMDAMSWLPDPRGSIVTKNFRWNGFEVEYTESEMEDLEFFNLEDLNKPNADRASSKQADREAKSEAAGLDLPVSINPQNTDEGGTLDDQVIYDMVDQFTQIKGDDGITRKYLVTVSDDLKSLHRCEEIKQVTTIEKENPKKVPFPISLNYYSPKPGNPFGISVPDLCEDKQRARSIFKNLRKKAEQAKLYPMYVYNRNKILNRRDLDFAFNKFIAVSGDATDTIIRPINKATEYQGDILNAEQDLENEAQKATGTNDVTQGARDDSGRPLGVEQMIQANASLKYMLGAKFNAWGDKRFWRLWYRMYQQYFSSAGKKLIRIQSAFGTRLITLKPKDIKTVLDPDIRIISKLELQQERQREFLQWQTIMPFITNDPTKPLASKRYAERRLARLQNVPQEEIAVIFPDSPDEVRAHMENELLSKNEDVPIDVENEDHLSHMVINSQAEDTDATKAHILKHNQAYILSGQKEKIEGMEAQRMAGNGQGERNQAQNQIANQNSNQMAQTNPASQSGGQGVETTMPINK